jgi:hypothetical protein
VETELEQYDCETCAIKAALAGLDDDNRRAWVTWQQVAHRIVVDLQAGGTVLGWALADLDPPAALACVERLSIIYDTLQPPKSTD